MIPRRSLLLAAAPLLWAGKRYKHSKLNFRIDLPGGWTVEEAPAGATISPPGVKVDSNREDNPEIYTLWAVEEDGSSEKDYIQGLRNRFKDGGIAVDRGGDLESFSSPGRPAVIYTFDFVHPERKLPHRIRVYAVQHKGKPLLLIAQGLRERVASRDALLRLAAKSIEW